MSEFGYKIRNQKAIHFLTFTIVEWIDVFTKPVYRDIIIESLKYCQSEKGLVVFAFVIMSNHVHVIFQSKSGKLSDTIRDIKSYTSKQILKAIEETNESRREWLLKSFKGAARKNERNSNYQLWIHKNHPMELESNKFLNQKLNYIHQNPVKACIVQNPEDYLYSSARNYADIPGLLDVTKIE